MNSITWAPDMYDADTATAALRLLVDNGFVLSAFDKWLAGDGFTDATRIQYQHDRDELVRAAIDNNAEAMHFGAKYLGLIQWQDRREEFLVPKAAKGLKFKPSGRHPDAVGKWLDKMLLAKPSASTPELWAMLTKKPPRGHVVEADSFGGTLYRLKPWTQVCTRSQWRDRVRRARERRAPK